MKKEKSVRKAEFQAALFRQLKSLIVPFIILAIILIGVLVISFLQGEAEQLREQHSKSIVELYKEIYA